jgi:hypothetical protein
MVRSMADPEANMLVDQIARARRFASAVGGVVDRQKFEAMAAELQRELDALRAAFPNRL